MLTFDLVADVPRCPEGHEYVSSSVSADGTGIFVFASAAEPDVPVGRRGRHASLRIVTVHPDWTAEIDVPDVDLLFPRCDLFGDGRMLIAGTRARWRGPRDFDLNGIVLDPAKGEREQFLLGDGIEDVGIDAQDRIWVSYFDEGVFGNYGWNHSGPTGPGAGGLVCFAPNGDRLWSFNDTVLPSIDDCYALNVQHETVWAYYYSAFELCEIDMNFRTQQISGVPVHGAKAFAVCDAGFVFWRQYREAADTFHVVPRTWKGLGTPRQVRGVLPGGVSFESSTVVGRGPVLHALNKGGWFATDISELF